MKHLCKDSKIAVYRHTRFAKSSARRCEKAIETRTRREAKKEAHA